MGFSPTKQQIDAINGKGNILVAAAAGSGKTAVLVERVINKLCFVENPVRADKLLIVTFTNVAAAEMRGRIEKRLEEECRKNPNDSGLIEQKHLLSSAKICTIDSFCIDLVRENFEKAGVSPDFKMSDGNSLTAINNKVLSQIINEYIEAKDKDFLDLLDLIGAEYDDAKFSEFVLDLYDYSRQMPFPKVWFDNLGEFYKYEKFDSNSPWWSYTFNTVKSLVDSSVKSLANAIDLVTVSEKTAKSYIPVFTIALEFFNSLESAINEENWDELYNLLHKAYLPSLPTVKGVGDICEVSSAKYIYKYVTTTVLEKLNRFIYADLELINSQFKKINKPLKLLISILKEFDDRIFNEYLKENTFTFHNTEHLALNLLCKFEDGEIKIKEEASEFLSRFDEVMVDEYQDTNNLQDCLFYVLSDMERKLFVVGDVKQSIYGFRGANPENFLIKKKRYVPYSEADEDTAKKIILSKNFRCKDGICNFINFFFENFMTSHTGKIVYDGEEALVSGALYPYVENLPVELRIVNSKKGDITLEAGQIAKYIKEIMSDGEVIKVDDTTLRKAKYSDFTILMRSLNKANVLTNELKKQGIPVDFGSEGFAETTEISTILSLLKILDNPQSDVELLCVMLSPIFSFTAEELALIRSDKKDGSLYSAIIFAKNNGNKKVAEFLKIIEKYRLLAVTTPLSKMISYLLSDTGYLDFASSLENGNTRRGNLLLLCEYAQQYSESNFDGLGGFVDFIIRQSQNKLKSADCSPIGDSVKIMSIHASKGLQFPVCIVAGIESDFNDNEAKCNTLYTGDFGIGFKYFDEDLKLPFTTIGREVILERLREQRREEELRLLYVAMTRAQDKLLFVGSISNLDKKMDDMKSLLMSCDGEISNFLFKQTKRYLDWILLCCMLHPDGKALRGEGSSVIVKDTNSQINIKIFENEEIDDIAEVEEAVISADEELVVKIKENMSYKYPYEELLTIEAKSSVSAIAKAAENAKYAFSVTPSFMAYGGITGAEKGTAMHKVMQYFDFSKYFDIESEIQRLCEWNFITEQQGKSINRKALKEFFESSVFKRILNAKLVKREMRFLTELPANEIKPDLSLKFSNENIIVQGAVDVCFVESDSIVILDFKTDRVSDEKALKDAYGQQLDIYAKACEKIFERPVKEKIIYSFALSKEIIL
ncbi:MAG: helicase-exonuclease AddAB subunit AddA [Clostridia bacterium]|nr:helicase-exonuclease AddAB subunit AddA [Clostridia bacterium]